MALPECLGLAALGVNVVGWGVGKACDVTVQTAHKNFLKTRTTAKLDPNHTIEKTVLTAHYRALEFIVEHAVDTDINIEDYSTRVKHVRRRFWTIFKDIKKGAFNDLIKNLSQDWRVVVPNTLEQQSSLKNVISDVPDAQINAALKDLLGMATWSDPEIKALTAMTLHPDFGWAPSFAACMREAIKDDTEFRSIYTAHVLQDQTDALTAIADQIMPAQDLHNAMARIREDLKDIKESLKRIEAKIGDLVDVKVLKNHYTNGVGHHYPRYLTKLLFNSDLQDDQWEQEISSALIRYMEGKTQLEQHTNLPADLDAKRKEALELYEQARLDEGEAILIELDTKLAEHHETVARDRAKILVDRVQFATARLDFNKAMDLYVEAAETVMAIDKMAAVEWLIKAGDLGYDRGLLFGGGFLSRATQTFQRAISLTTDKNNQPLSGYESTWAMTQNSLGNVYNVQGERGKDGVLEKAVKAFEAALTVYTREAAPINLAMTQNNLGNLYQIQGQRGEDGALEEAVKAYEAALAVLTREAAPTQWALTQNNLGNVYQIQGQRGEDGAMVKAVKAFEAALTVYTREAAPMHWAVIQNNLGSAYSIQGQRGEDGALEKAVKAFEAALTIYTQEAAPTQWAMTQNNLGNVYVVLGQRGEDAALEKAVKAYEAALTVRTREAAPMNWAVTTENLGDCYWAMDRKEKAEPLWRAALAEYKRQEATYHIKRTEHWMHECGLEP